MTRTYDDEPVPEEPAIDPDATFTILVRLPQPLDAFSAILRHLGDLYPQAVIDTNHPGGWRVVIEAEQ